MRDADWPTERKFPRYQIYSVEELLEQGVVPLIPDTYANKPLEGVGKLPLGKHEQQPAMDDLFD